MLTFTIPNFKLYYRVIAIKTAWYWQKNRHDDQWNRTEDPHMRQHNYAYLIFHKGAKKYDGEKPLQQMFLGNMDICLQKTETRSMPISLYLYHLKVD
jgi:hypothetical protein